MKRNREKRSNITRNVVREFYKFQLTIYKLSEKERAVYTSFDVNAFRAAAVSNGIYFSARPLIAFDRLAAVCPGREGTRRT